MKNYIHAGENVATTAPAALLSGAGVLVGAMFGVATSDAASGAQVIIRTQGVFNLPKDANAIGLGVRVYWDNTAKKVTATSASNTLIGVALIAALAGDSAVRVRLNGSF